MSVAGILAGNFLAGLGTQYAQPSQLSPINTSNAASAFAAVQQKLSGPSSAIQPSSTPISSELTQLGQDLKLGNLSAAEADYSALKLAIAQRHTHVSGKSGSGESGNSQDSALGISDPLAAAMLAYSSLQQSASNGALSSSLINPTSTFSIDA